MNCFSHDRMPAIGVCCVCHRAVCRDCIASDSPRLVCRPCAARGGVLYGFEYRSAMRVGSWPLIHICGGVDPLTMKPKVAKGVIAIGDIALGGVAIGGLACGLLTIGGASIGLLFALGGAAIGAGFSMGGAAVGSIAVGGLAVGFKVAMGGAAFGPAVIDRRSTLRSGRARLHASVARLPRAAELQVRS
jgi:hypothetical protein